MLKTERSSFSYNSSYIFTFPDILLDQGEDLLILGDSGVGKTTLIQILSGLLSPQSGFVEMHGTRFQNLSSKSLDQFRGSHIGMVFQQSHFVRNLSVLDNLLLSLYLSNMHCCGSHHEDDGGTYQTCSIQLVDTCCLLTLYDYYDQQYDNGTGMELNLVPRLLLIQALHFHLHFY